MSTEIGRHAVPFRRLLACAGWGALAALLAPGPALAVGTAFTYQGRLSRTARPRRGPYDLEIKLFDAAAGARSSVTTLTYEDVRRRQRPLHGGPGLRPRRSRAARAGWRSACGPARPPARSHATGAAGADAVAQRALRATATLGGHPRKPPGFADDVDATAAATSPR